MLGIWWGVSDTLCPWWLYIIIYIYWLLYDMRSGCDPVDKGFRLIKRFRVWISPRSLVGGVRKSHIGTTLQCFQQCRKPFDNRKKNRDTLFTWRSKVCRCFLMWHKLKLACFDNVMCCYYIWNHEGILEINSQYNIAFASIVFLIQINHV